jgi:hypothetical protein
MADPYASYYGTLASYFGQSGGTGSPGKAGGAGYNNDSTVSTSGSGASTGDVQNPSASSGSGWISAAASTSTSDKSNFSTPFTQGFGGITNNQIIQSPGATNNASTNPISAPPTIGLSAPGGLFGALDPLTLAVIAAIAFLLFRR